MTGKLPHKPVYVQPERAANGRRVARGTLKHGLKIVNDLHLEFELQEALTADLLLAEASAEMDKPLSYAAALLACQLTRIGSYTGPFTVGMIGTLKTRDFWTLRAAQAEFELVGEAE